MSDGGDNTSLVFVMYSFFRVLSIPKVRILVHDLLEDTLSCKWKRLCYRTRQISHQSREADSSTARNILIFVTQIQKIAIHIGTVVKQVHLLHLSAKVHYGSIDTGTST